MSSLGETLTVRASDGFELAASLHRTEAPPRFAALIAPAMGVPRRVYAPFAAFLGRQGIASLSLDYRGIGGSRPKRLRGFRAALHDWGELDLPAGLAALRAAYPGLPIAFVGHSVGGQLFGLGAAEPDVRAALFFASQSGHWRHWSGARRLLMAALWNGAMPALASAIGFLPMRAMGQGEDLPAGVALEWARWGRHPDYVLSYARERGGLGFGRWGGALRAYGFQDDGYAPPAAVEALAQMYSGSRREVRIVSPGELGLRAIGHFGWLRPTYEAPLWAPAVAWLSGAVGD
ncbi:MAG: alpha/beta hydrolase family protein [Deltaproteobacteria bacterium]